jgi:hypothetical protein
VCMSCCGCANVVLCRSRRGPSLARKRAIAPTSRTHIHAHTTHIHSPQRVCALVCIASKIARCLRRLPCNCMCPPI